MSNSIKTIIVLRNDATTDWAKSTLILEPGELGVGYIYETDAEGNNTNVIKNVIVKAGDGANTWENLKQLEGVFEQPVTLTQNFGYYNDVPSGGYKTYENTQGMTTTEFLLSALKKTVEPTITQPSASLSASATVENNDAEIGAKITALNWDGTNSYGSYKIGNATQSTNLVASNFTWAVSNNKTTSTSSSIDGSFTLSDDQKITVDTEGAKTYAVINATVTLDPSNAATPKNNLGENTTGKIIGFDTAGTKTKTPTANVSVTSYRKPFWGVLTTSLNIETLTSDEVRGLSGKGTSTQGFPSALEVAEGSRQVIFCAKKGAYKSLSATDSKAMNAVVTFTKHEGAVSVKGANNFTATDYDVWEVTWADPIAAAKSLVLTWTK